MELLKRHPSVKSVGVRIFQVTSVIEVGITQVEDLIFVAQVNRDQVKVQVQAEQTSALKSVSCFNLISADGLANATDGTYAPPVVNKSSPSQPAPTRSVNRPLSALWSPVLKLPFWDHFLPLVLDQDRARVVMDSIVDGVRIGRAPADLTIVNPNWQSAMEFRKEVSAIIEADLALDRLYGPFSTPPYTNYTISPLGAFMKRNSNKVRVIHDLSYPASGSVNSHIDPESFTLKYASIDDAVDFILSMDSESIFMSKMDLKDAYKHVYINHLDWHHMGFSWANAAGQVEYYFSKVLNFGLRSAPFLFDSIAAPLASIMFHRGVRSSMIRYVDDFLILAPSYGNCESNLSLMLDTARLAGFQIQDSKVTAPAQVIEFLGIIIDTVQNQLRISEQRLMEIKSEATHWLDLGVITKRKLLSILGKCAFAARVIRAGKPFLSRLFLAANSVKYLHHRIRLSSEAKADLSWWVACIAAHNGVSVIKPDWVSGVVHIYTDASSLGFSGFMDREWFSVSYTGGHRWMLEKSINWREMQAAVAALHTWAPQLVGRSIIFHIDNMTACSIFNSGYSPVPHLMFFCRHWFMIIEKFNLNVAPVYIASADNLDADDLSRLRVLEFQNRNPSVNKLMTWPDETFMEFDY